ncbi:hypothetical protein [Nesterenkonia muleiensis]|uniref:hypothetical protein n=1 Tax=Nesterenkonia muleiensis TaxID=2282648 RepID=UPI001300398E|nr:hypothetical protein [Nesterenkonia muleiensis]
MENNPLEYDNHPESALDEYLTTTRYMLEGVIADQGKAFEAYLDSISPDDIVDEMAEDFMRRFVGDYSSKREAIESLMGHDCLKKYTEDELWEHIEMVYEAVYPRDGQIYLFIPDTTGGRHG